MRAEVGTLYILRGLPGSGKSTWACRFVAAWPAGRVARLNRDNLRAMALPADYVISQGPAEMVITVLQHAAIPVLLRAGVDVVVDDTNLHDEHVAALVALAREAGAPFEIVDEFLRVPVDECVRRDAERPRPVGETVIRGMHERHLVTRCAP